MERDAANNLERQLRILDEKVEHHTKRLMDIERKLSLHYTSIEILGAEDLDDGVAQEQEFREPILQKASKKRFDKKSSLKPVESPHYFWYGIAFCCSVIIATTVWINR